MVRLASQRFGSFVIAGLYHSLRRQSIGTLLGYNIQPMVLSTILGSIFLWTSSGTRGGDRRRVSGDNFGSRTRRLEHRQPTARHQFRPFRTAGTDAHKYSAAYARICLASRIAFPLQQAEADVQTFVRSYTTYGYNVQLLKKAASSFLRQRTSP